MTKSLNTIFGSPIRRARKTRGGRSTKPSIPNLKPLKKLLARLCAKAKKRAILKRAWRGFCGCSASAWPSLAARHETQDAADLIATTPNGHFAVIECTTGLLKADNKLPLLYDRSQAVRRALETSAHNQLRVLPMIVTTKSREEIMPDLEQAERLGILVLSREKLEGMLETRSGCRRRIRSRRSHSDGAYSQNKHENQEATLFPFPQSINTFPRLPCLAGQHPNVYDPAGAENPQLRRGAFPLLDGLF